MAENQQDLEWLHNLHRCAKNQTPVSTFMGRAFGRKNFLSTFFPIFSKDAGNGLEWPWKVCGGAGNEKMAGFGRFWAKIWDFKAKIG